LRSTRRRGNQRRRTTLPKCSLACTTRWASAVFFARLYAAEALRRRYPLSEQTVTAFDTAAALLLEVGEARAHLQAHLRAARAAVAAQRRAIGLTPRRAR
jgi:hypothetical protein